MMAAGEFARARQNLETALKTPSEWIGDHDLYTSLVDLAVRQHDRNTVRKYAAKAEEMATRYDHELYRAIAQRAWGVFHRLDGDYVAARTSLNQALALFSQLNTRWQMGRTLFELGELAVTEANNAEARGFFTRALEAFEQMHAAPDVERTRTAMEAYL